MSHDCRSVPPATGHLLNDMVGCDHFDATGKFAIRPMPHSELRPAVASPGVQCAAIRQRDGVPCTGRNAENCAVECRSFHQLG